jgi:glutathione peroxidase
MMTDSVYDFSCMSIDGERRPLAQYRGSVLLVVNTASYCGFTPQFKGLEYLYRKFKSRGLVVLGFPCNQFASQDPRNNDRITDFCVRNYGVSFPMFAKIKVNGADTEPLFDYLKMRAPGIFGTRSIKWNFTKFLVDRNGQVIDRFGAGALPRNLEEPIERLLAQ